MPVPMHALADNFAGGDVERGEQGRRAMTLVIVRHSACAASLHRQSRLCAIEGLDLALLIDAQHQRLVGRVEIEPHDVLNFFGELRIVRQLEGLRQVRFEPMRGPDALHAGMAEACRPCQLARRPMRARRRLLVKRHINHALDRRCTQRLLAARSACIAPQTFDPTFNIVIAPAIGRAFGLASRCAVEQPRRMA